MARVVIENLGKSFKSGGRSIPAVNNFNLTVEDRELLVLVGPSGCGKTTTLRLVAGLEEPNAGTISIDGKPMKGVAPRNRDVAMVFQSHALYPHLTAHENMAFGLKLRKHSQAEIAQRVEEAATILELKDCLTRKPGALSGGQRQRVALGRAMVRQPKVFLFDEPLSNLDAPTRAQLRREIARLHKRIGATILYVTHDQSEAMTLAGRIAVMRDGAVQQIAAATELYERPSTRFVAGFIGSPPMNFFRGTLARNSSGLFFESEATVFDTTRLRLRVDDETAPRLKSFIGKNIVLGIRPEHIAEGSGNADDGRTVGAVTEIVEPMGPETNLFATSAGHSFTARLRGAHSPALQKRISLAFDMSRAHFFDPATEKAIAG